MVLEVAMIVVLNRLAIVKKAVIRPTSQRRNIKKAKKGDQFRIDITTEL